MSKGRTKLLSLQLMAHKEGFKIFLIREGDLSFRQMRQDGDTTYKTSREVMIAVEAALAGTAGDWVCTKSEQ